MRLGLRLGLGSGLRLGLRLGLALGFGCGLAARARLALDGLGRAAAEEAGRELDRQRVSGYGSGSGSG